MVNLLPELLYPICGLADIAGSDLTGYLSSLSLMNRLLRSSIRVHRHGSFDRDYIYDTSLATDERIYLQGHPEDFPVDEFGQAIYQRNSRGSVLVSKTLVLA